MILGGSKMIKVIIGCMKSGKSEEIARIVTRAKIAGTNFLVFKPDIDRRFGEGSVVSRSNMAKTVDCIVIPASNSSYMFSIIDDSTELVIIDEAQFFNPNYKMDEHLETLTTYYPIVNDVQKLADKGIKVIIMGLDMDSDRKPFGPVPQLMAIADEVVKIKAVCEDCGGEAIYSYANFEKTEQVVLGDSEYKALCRKCYLRRQPKILF